MSSLRFNLPLVITFVLAGLSLPAARAQSTGTALVRHGITVNGAVDGSLQQVLGENAKVNSGGSVTGDLLVPGTPTVVLNNPASYGGTLDGTGATTPTGYTVTLQSGVSARHVVRRSNPPTVPTVSAPPSPTGTTDVTVNSSSQSINWSTIRNVTLGSNVGQITVPPGTYGKFTVNSGSAFVLGIAGATQPAVYNIQQLTLNSSSQLLVAGPVVINVAGNTALAGPAGDANHLSWLQLNSSAGDLTLNSSGYFYGYATAPAGTVTLNTSSQFVGGSISDKLTVGANCLLRLVNATPQNVAPSVALSGPTGGRIFAAPATIVLTATATDADGAIARVEFFDGATKLGEAAVPSAPPSTFTLTATLTALGTHSLTVKATDNAGATTTSPAVSITIDGPPTIAFNSPAAGATFTAPTTVPLVVQASDGDGTIAKVSFFNGPTLLGELTVPDVAGGSIYTLNQTFTSAGSFSLTAVVIDNLGISTTSAAVAIAIRAPNEPPTIAITAPQNGSVMNAPASFSLVANATDSDGSVTKVEFFSGMTKLGERTAPDTLGGATFTFPLPSPLPAGMYSFTARATDNESATATSATVSVLVNAPPAVAIVDPPPGVVFTTPVTISVTAAATDADGSIAKVEFYQDSAKVGEKTAPDSPGGSTFTFTSLTPASAGNYTFSVQATDNRGAHSPSASVTVLVNTPPAVALTGPANNAIFIAPASFTLAASAVDNDGAVTKVEFFQGATKLGESATAPYQFAVSNLAAGNYAFTAKATDNVGAVTVSDAIAVVVDAPPVVAISAPADNAPFNAPADFTLSAEASDTDGTVASVEFFQDGVSIGVITAAPYQLPIVHLAAGSHTFSAKATDNNSATATSASVTVLVNAPPTVALSASPNDSAFVAPASFSLVADAADSDGTVTQVEFFRSDSATPIATVTAAPFRYSVVGLAAGSYEFTARATDNRGATATSSALAVTVNPNTPPAVALTAPVNNAVFTPSASIAFAANASDADGTIAKVEFFQGTAKLGEATSPSTPPSTFSFVLTSGLPSGAYTLTARATDNGGAATTSAIVAIVVNAPPTADAKSVAVIRDKPATITLTGSDPENSPLTFALVASPTHGSLTGTPPNLTYQPAAGYTGPDSFTFKANDGTADSNVATITINVAAPVNQAPVANAGPDRTIPLSMAFGGGKIVVNGDDWTLSSGPINDPNNSARQYAKNIAKWFTGGRPGKFLVYSESFGLTSAELAGVMTGAGHTWTVTRNVPFTLTTLQAYDGVWLLGNPADNQTLIDYVRGGGNVYVGAGGGGDDGQQWKTFLTAFGLRFGAYSASNVNVPTGTASHPIFEGTTGYLWYFNPNDIDRLNASDPSTAIVLSNNGEPVVGVYSPSTLPIFLQGSVADDGLPVGSTVTSTWSNVSGPSPAIFETPGSPTSGVRFNAAGTYVMRLSASDGALTGTDDVVYSVVSNLPPVIAMAGYVTSPTAGTAVALPATVTDDGAPAGGTVTTLWSPVGGPAVPTFADATQASTTATFPVPGVYTIKLTATDGLDESTAFVEARIGAPSPLASTNGIVAWWKANGSGRDEISGKNMYLLDGATYAPGKVSSAFSFDGIDDNAVFLGGPTTDIATGSFTIEMWVMPGSGADVRLLTWHDSLVRNASLQIIDGGRLRFYFGGVGDFVQSDQVMTAGVWQHIAVAYDKPANRVAMYRNGVRLTNDVIGFPIRTVGNIHLAAEPYDTRFHFGGRMDEILLHSRALGPTEIGAIWQADALGRVPVPTGYNFAVNAGAAQFASSTTKVVTLSGSVAETPALGLPITATWSRVEGPVDPQFANANAAATTATFSVPGLYLLKLTATNGLATASSLVEVRVGVASAVEVPADIAAWWPGNGTPREVVGGRDALLLNGVTYASGKVAQAFVFDGTNDIARVAADAALDVGQGPGFTIEMWINPTVVKDCTLLEWNNNGQIGSGLVIRDGGRYAADFYNTSGLEMLVQSDQITATNTWQHIALTYDKASGFGKVYKNGVLVAQTNLGTFTPQTSWDLYFGGRGTGTNRLFAGMIDEPAIYRRALSASELAEIVAQGPLGKAADPLDRKPVVNAGADIALASPGTVNLNGFAADDGRLLPLLTEWSKIDGPPGVTFGNANLASTTATFTTPGLYTLRLYADDGPLYAVDHLDVRVGLATSPVAAPANLVAWWRGNNETYESVRGLYNVDLLNGATFGPGQVGNGFKLDGVDDTGHVLAYSDLDLGASAAGFSIEFWTKPEVIPTSSVPLIQWASSTQHGLELWSEANGAVSASFWGTGQGGTTTASNVLSAGAWTHVALTFDRATGVARIYKNGVQAGTANMGAGFIARTTGDLYFGSNPYFYAGKFYQGTLDEVSFYTRPLSAAEVQSIANAGAAGKFLPPTNVGPAVNAGADAVAYLNIPTFLAGSVSDDGLPNPPAAVTSQWTRVSGPGSMTFGNDTSPATTATFTATGTQVLRLTASDSARTASDDVTYSVVVPPSNPPTIAFTQPANNATLAAGRSFDLVVNAADSDGTIAKVEFFQGTTKLGERTTPEVGNPNSYFFTLGAGLPVGTYTFTARTTDNSGITIGTAPLSITVITDPGSPEASLAAPTEDTRVSQPVDVTGVASSPLLASWKLQRRLKAAANQPDEPWTTFATGTSSVGSTTTPGTFAKFDPTLLINGIYEINLSVTDTAGREKTLTEPVTLVVEGNMKVGAFTLAFEDLKIPVAGIPITITRTYDSRDSRVGDFGPGWRVAVDNIRVQKNRNLGADWNQTDPNGSTFQSYFVTPVRDRIVTVVFPEGETHRFRAGALVKQRDGDDDNESFPNPAITGKYRFYPIGDTTAKLEPLNQANQLFENIWIYGTGNQDLMTGDVGDSSATIFNPSRYRLTTKDGTVWILDEALGLLSMTDLNGNTLVLNRDAQNRVTSVVSTQNAPSGPIATSVTLHRDTMGRVDYIRDPANKEIDYLYDTTGHLASFTDRVLNVTQFRYESATFPNYLTKIIDPRGVAAIRTEFDDSGRMVKQIDADGKETVFTHQITGPTTFENIKDRLGNETTLYYDERGNVVLKRDPLGAQTSYSYYPDSDWVKFETDHYGNVKSFAYDAHGNITVETLGASTAEDPANPTTGYTTRTAYNAYCSPTQFIDADGRVQSFTYDPVTNDLLTQTVGVGGPAPATTVHTYTADGSLGTATDALGNVTSYSYDYAFNSPDYPGAVKQITTTVTDPAGSAGSDAANATATVLRVTRTLFDIQGWQIAQIVTRTLPDNSTEEIVTRYLRDNENRLAATIMPDGRVTEKRYTSFGKDDKLVLWKSVADYTAHVDANARITAYGYDARGNQTSITYADGTTEQMHFDLENRKDWSQDRRGYRTFFSYDAVGRLRFTIHPDATDGVGAAAPQSLTDPRLADNPRSETQYDLIGRVRFELDERGTTTEYTYENGCGCAMRRQEMIQHRSAGNLVTHYEYDKAGNVRYVTDPRGNTVETQYDEHRRPTRVIYPATDENPSTQIVTQYDLLSHRVATVDQEAKVTRLRYDALDRVIEARQYLDQTLAALDAGYNLAPTAAGVISTRYAYDELGNQRTQTDALGRVTSFWTDNMGRRTKRVLPKDSSESTFLSESLLYDEWGNLWKRTDFSGKTTTFGYDTLNRLKSKAADATHPSLAYGHAIARIEFDYDANGLRTAARTYAANNLLLYQESTPRDERGRIAYKDTTAGRLGYDYYADNLLKDVVSSNSGGVNVGYRYDEVNRLESVDDASTGLPTRTTSYTYNANGSLETITTPNGVVRTYGYDTLNRLRSLLVTHGATQVHAYDFRLRTSGRRREMVENAMRTTDYGYDDVYRLKSETISGDVHLNNGSVGYELDKVGNRTNRTSDVATVPVQLNQSYNARDWLAGESYSLNGSTILTQVLAPALRGTDVYDFEEHLLLRTKSDGSTIQISYDADGHRIAKTLLNAAAQPVAATTWLLDDNNLTGYCQVVEERSTTAVGATLKVYTYGTGLISQAISANGGSAVVNYYTHDGHGSVRELTDASGAVTDEYDYDAFGILIRHAGATSNAYLYCGEQYDGDLGLYYLRARYLSVEEGRFWTMDEFPGENEDPVSLHRYLYANADPLKFLDPSGETSLVELQIVQNGQSNINKMSQPTAVQARKKGVKYVTCIAGVAMIERWTDMELSGGQRPEGHHPIPQSMGGAANQALLYLPVNTHRAFHAVLNVFIKADTVLGPLGMNNYSSKADWEQLLLQNPGAKKALIEVLKKAAKVIDDKCDLPKPVNLQTYIENNEKRWLGL